MANAKGGKSGKSGRKPSYPDPSTLSADALKGRRRRVKRKLTLGKATAEDRAWLAKCEQFDRGQGRKPKEPAVAGNPDGWQTVPDNPPPVQSTDPKPARTASAPRDAADAGPKVEHTTPAPDYPYAPRSAGTGNAGAPPPNGQPGADGSASGGAGQPPPAGAPGSGEQSPLWREKIADGVTVWLRKVNAELEAESMPSMPSEMFAMTPWAINDWLHERFPDSSLDAKALRNYIIGMSVGGTGACYGLAHYKRWKRERDLARAQQAQRAEAAASSRKAEDHGHKAEPEPQPSAPAPAPANGSGKRPDQRIAVVDPVTGRKYSGMHAT